MSFENTLMEDGETMAPKRFYQAMITRILPNGNYTNVQMIMTLLLVKLITLK